METEKLDFFELEEKRLRQEVEIDFNFKKDLIAYVDKKYSVENELSKKINDEYKKAIKEKDMNILKKLAERIENHIDYIRPKSHDTDEQKKNLIKLEMLHEKILKWIDELILNE